MPKRIGDAIGIAIINRIRARDRRRLDPVPAHLAGSIPPALENPRRRLVRRRTAAIVTAAILGGGAFWGSGVVSDNHQDEDARLYERYRNTAARADVLEDAYAAAYAGEMRDRGFSEERINQAQWASLEKLTDGEPDTDGITPQHTATLEIERQLEDAIALREQLRDQAFSD